MFTALILDNKLIYTVEIEYTLYQLLSNKL